MQRIAIIGGTGMTGQCVVKYALEKGLTVRLLYRSEATLPQDFKEKVELVQGNVLNKEDCERIVDGVDGVCIVLGTRNNVAPTTEMSTGTENLIEAMKKKNVRRFSIVLSSFLFMDEDKVPAMFHAINSEHKRMLELTKTSGLDYTAILPPHIADVPSSEYVVTYGSCPVRTVSKYDLAKFIVDCLSQSEHIGKMCGVHHKAKE